MLRSAVGNLRPEGLLGHLADLLGRNLLLEFLCGFGDAQRPKIAFDAIASGHGAIVSIFLTNHHDVANNCRSNESANAYQSSMSPGNPFELTA